MTTEFAITSIDVDLPSLGHRRLPFSDASGATSRSTILVGRNGTGKSTILRELAMAFRAYFAVEKQGGRQGRDRVESISIRYNSDHATLNLKSSAQDFRIERDDVTERGLRPRRLIALSFTPFDKFPPADDTYQRDGAVSVDPFYVYLGFKNDYRSLSPRGRLLRSIDQLAFSQSTPQADQRVVEAFAAIGYDPIIKITYHLNVSRLRQLQEIDEARLAMIVSQIETFARETGGKRRELSYSIDFRYGRRDLSLPIGFDEIHELAKAGILRLTAVTLDRLEGEAVEMLELSSGELNLLSGFLGLAAFLEDGCLILIDEPENSLHPEWQQRYVTMLEAVLRQHEGCHYVIATHSPLIVSGVADRNAKVLRLDQDPVELDSRVVADMSPDANLAIACKQCNIAKSEHDVLRPQPRPNPRIETVPAESPRYSVPHPWVDDWNAFLRHVNFQIYVSETDKGLELINLCKLNKTAVDDGGLSYDSVVAAIRNGFFDIIENSIEPSPPDTEVLKRVARMTDTQHDLQADARLVALGKTLKTQERKAGRRTPDQAVAEAAQLLRENERRLRQTRDRDITNFLKDAPVKRGPPALPPPKLALPPPSDPEVNE